MTAEKIGRGLQSVCEWNGAVGIENGLRMERGVLICRSSAKENRQTDCMCSERLLYILYVQTDRKTDRQGPYVRNWELQNLFL